MKFRVASLQADNAAAFHRATARYVADELGWELSYVDDVPWERREQLLDAGDLDAAFVCGWPYTCKIAAQVVDIRLVVAPAFAAARYGGWPVYFSDVIVPADSDVFDFAQLRGRSWAYNEPRSHSGYNLTLYHLAQLGETDGYFGEVVQAGAHQAAIDLVAGGRVDASAIDSYVLDVELSLRPELGQGIRVIDTLGPSPSPPFVVAGHIPIETRQSIADILTAMHETDAGQAILRDGLVERYLAVTDRDYDPVRTMADRARGVKLFR